MCNIAALLIAELNLLLEIKNVLQQNEGCFSQKPNKRLYESRKTFYTS
jgi:hypothetical protein